MSGQEHVFTKLITLKYGSNPPQPGPAVTEPTPDDEYKHYIEQQEQKSREAQTEAQRAKEEASKEESMLGKIGKFGKSTMTQLGDATQKTHMSIEGAARGQLESRSRSQFKEAFPALAEEKLHCAYPCRAMHSGQRIEGTFFVSDKHVAFSGKGGVKEDIALADVFTVQPSVALKTSKAQNGKEDGPPFILPIPDQCVVPDCVQLFARNGNLYQFVDFGGMMVDAAKTATTSVKGTACERVFNWVDHAWRAATPVPHPDATYFNSL